MISYLILFLSLIGSYFLYRKRVSVLMCLASSYFTLKKGGEIDVENGDTYIKLNYEKDGKNTLFIPFDVELRNRMMGKKVYLMKPDGTKEDVTHPQGVPYFLKAKMVGGSYYMIYDEIEGSYEKMDSNNLP